MELEGTLVLEKLAEVGLVDDFAAAVDRDDAETAAELMREAQVDEETIALVLEEMGEG